MVRWLLCQKVTLVYVVLEDLLFFWCPCVFFQSDGHFFHPSKPRERSISLKNIDPLVQLKREWKAQLQNKNSKMFSLEVYIPVLTGFCGKAGVFFPLRLTDRSPPEDQTAEMLPSSFWKLHINSGGAVRAVLFQKWDVKTNGFSWV